MNNQTFKFVVVVNKKLEPGVAMNATAHLCLSLMAQAGNEQRKIMHFIDYIDADNAVYPSISGLSLIVLRGKEGHMKKFIAAAKEKDMITSAFIKTMTGDTYKEQLEQTKATETEDIVYYGVAAFGPKEEMDTMTKKFSLYQ